MVKKIRRVLAICLAVVLCMSLVPATVFADGTTVETDAEGLTVTTTQKTTSTTDEDGNVTVTITIDKKTEGTTADGVVVDREEHREDMTVTNAEGEEIGTTFTEEGSEKKEWDEEVAPGQDVPVVEAGVMAGGETPATATDTKVETDPVTGETITTTTDREVTTQASDVTVKAETSDSNLTAVKPEDYEGKYSETGNHLFHSYKDGALDSYKVKGEAPEGADYQYITDSDHGVFWVSQIMVVYEKDKDGNTVYDENGKPVIEKLTKKDGTVMLDPETLEPSKDLNKLWKFYNEKTGKYEFAKTGTRPTMFMLKTPDGKDAYGYCIDLITPTVDTSWYSVANLEDSDYYASEEAEDHIRSIVLNGYWGTDTAPDENGKYKTGSVSKIKESLKKALENGEIEDEYTYTYYPGKDGGDANTGSEAVTVTVKLSDILEGLTAGEALAATQAAIWSYANGSEVALNGKDGMVIANTFYGQLGRANDYTPENAARVEALYKWLVNLETDEDSTVVINDKNFVKDVSLSVGGKDADHADNKDDNSDNDVYNADLNFHLAFVPGAKDDLLVQISYTDLDGNPVTVVRRLAGKNAEGQDYETLHPEADGSYLLKGLKLSENKDFGFDLRLEGTQYLENGVYIYTPVGGRGISQSMVGISEGTRTVDIEMSMTVSFNVDENNHVVAERVWNDAGDPIILPEGGIEGGEEEDTLDENPVVPGDGEIVEPELEIEEIEKINKVTIKKANTETILDEEVPLAAAPKTGDYTFVLIAVIAVLALGIAATFVIDKKRKSAKH